jgi:hypothetical protein
MALLAFPSRPNRPTASTVAKIPAVALRQWISAENANAATAARLNTDLVLNMRCSLAIRSAH